jgi:hypothetical protein
VKAKRLRRAISSCQAALLFVQHTECLRASKLRKRPRGDFILRNALSNGAVVGKNKNWQNRDPYYALAECRKVPIEIFGFRESVCNFVRSPEIQSRLSISSTRLDLLNVQLFFAFPILTCLWLKKNELNLAITLEWQACNLHKTQAEPVSDYYYKHESLFHEIFQTGGYKIVIINQDAWIFKFWHEL